MTFWIFPKSRRENLSSRCSFDLVETVESTLDLLSETAHGKGVELACEITPNVQARLRGDAGRLRQILTNLVSNAIKFTEKGEVVVRLSIASQTETHATMRFEIEDTGIGGTTTCIRPRRLFFLFSATRDRRISSIGLFERSTTARCSETA